MPGRRGSLQHERVAAPAGTGLVLGAGGVLGAAWMTGALAALQARMQYSAAEVGVLLGTSAGSVLAAALRCGFGVRDLVGYQRGAADSVLGVLGPPDLGCSALPPLPALRPGSPRLLLRALQGPGRVRPAVPAAAGLPQGRASHDVLRRVVSGLLAHTCGEEAPAEGWPSQGRTLIAAVDYDAGRRVAFGRPGSPRAGLADAVVASCAIPGWYRPARIGGHRYVDGGIWPADGRPPPPGRAGRLTPHVGSRAGRADAVTARCRLTAGRTLSVRLIWSLLHQPAWFGGVAAMIAGFLLQPPRWAVPS